MPAELYQASPKVAFRQLGEECLLVPIRRSPDEELAVFTLNRVGVCLWSRMQQSACSISELTDAVVTRFEVDRDLAERDVRAFLVRLENHALVSGVQCAVVPGV